MKRVLAIQICGLVLLGLQPVQAQFHKEKDGQRSLNQGTANPMRKPGEPDNNLVLRGRVSKDLGLNDNSMIIVTDEQRTEFRQNNLRMGEQKDMQVHHLARSIQHSDGSFTQTNIEIGTKFATQETKSKNGVLLLRRDISFDERGNPKEVLMYDGYGKLKYRGVLIYDELGRFKEEQLFDAEGEALRRKIQEYDMKGQKLRLRTLDYVKNLPKDLRLVITRESERQDREQAQPEQNKPERRGFLFGKRDKKTQPGVQQIEAAQGQAPVPPAQTKKKKSIFDRFRFGKKKGEK